MKLAMGKLKDAVAHAPDVTERDRSLVPEIEKIDAAYAPVALAIVAMTHDGHRDEAIAKMNADCRPLLAALLKSTGEFIAYEHAGAEQSTGIAQVNQAVASIDEGTQQNAALVEESAAAAESLKQQAVGLMDVIRGFNTGDRLHAMA